MGIHVAFPDPISILPYLELFTLVTLKPDAVVSCRIATPHLLRLSVLRNNRFQAAPDGTTPAAAGIEAVFAALISRIGYRVYECEEIRCAQRIAAILLMHTQD
jgi:predicted hydrocarbon binding protein